MFLYLWQFWSHSKRYTIFRISRKNWIDYNDEISKLWEKIWKIAQKTKKQNYFSLWGLIEAHKTSWDWKTILNVCLNVPLNEAHKTT